MSMETVTVKVDASEVNKRIVEVLEADFSDEEIYRGVIAWFSPHHPDQGDYLARMRKAIRAVLLKEAP